MTDTRTQTYGETAVGLSFNPSADSEVDAIKREFAALIDRMDRLRMVTDTPGKRGSEQARLASIAITEMQAAQMWAVKAVTWKD